MSAQHTPGPFASKQHEALYWAERHAANTTISEDLRQKYAAEALRYRAEIAKPKPRWPRNTAPLKCWQCNKSVPVSEGIMTSDDFPAECYHDACYPIMVRESFPGHRAYPAPDVLANHRAAIAAFAKMANLPPHD